MAKLYELTREQVKILRQGLALLEYERRKPRSILQPPLPDYLQTLLTYRALENPVRDKGQGE